MAADPFNWTSDGQLATSTAPTSTFGFGGGLGVGGLLSAFGGGMAATAAYSAAKNQQAALNAQAQVEANNAQLAEWQADDAIARGDTAVNVEQLKGAQIKSTQRNAMAANGVDLSGGSAQNVMNSADYMTSVDEATIRTNAARAAWGYQVQATNALNRSAAAKSAAEQVSPWLAAGTSLLSSATSVASRWYQANLKQNGA
jgi:hypothetical protein